MATINIFSEWRTVISLVKIDLPKSKANMTADCCKSNSVLITLWIYSPFTKYRPSLLMNRCYLIDFIHRPLSENLHPALRGVS